MLNDGDRVGRFRVTWAEGRAVPRGVDDETGRPVIFPEPWPQYFLDVSAMRAQARAIREVGDPRFAEVLSVDPVVLEGPPEARPKPTLGEVVDASIELVGAVSRAMHAGAAVAVHLAWIRKKTSDGARVCVPAPSQALGLHFAYEHRPPMLADIADWVLREVQDAASFRQPISQSLRAAIRELPTDDAPAFVRALVPHASDPEHALHLAEAIPAFPDRFVRRLDIERGIELGEAQLERERARPAPWSGRGRPTRSETAYTLFALAATYHHRGCVAWQQGDADAAERDVARAIELDPHARYLTSAALFAERRGRLDEALALHDRAVATIQPRRPDGYGEDAILVFEDGYDPPERAARDAARTLHARGALLGKLGRTEARRDLQASLARHPTEGARRALSALPPSER